MTMQSTSRFAISQGISQIEPYKPGKPEEELMRELGLPTVIKLASNENCLGPSPRAIEAIEQTLPRANRYPDGSGYYLRQALSNKLGVPASRIMLGNGSTDLVEIIARTYLQPGHNSITARQTFLMYRLATLSMNAAAVEVPNRDYAYDPGEMLEAIDKNTKIVFIANPNNPTGMMIPKSEMDRFLAEVPAHVLVVLDEAYFEYIERNDFPNGLDYLSRFPNLIVLRTFSKIYGLAGIRIGYALASDEIIALLNRIRSPFNTSLVAQAAGIAALEDVDHVRRTLEHNRKERSFLEERLAAMRIRVLPSVTNFLLLLIPDAATVYEKLLRSGIITRPMGPFNLPEGLRVTVGRHEENVAFLKALEQSLHS
jgi:histidinol-phosphate aminotransferase